METVEKQCTKCLTVLPLERFSKCNREKDGLQDWCKGCKKASADQRRQINPELDRKYYLANRIMIRERENLKRRRNPKRTYEINKRSIEKTRRSGIYQIVAPTGEVYFGSTTNTRDRWGKHKHSLLRGYRTNTRLQELSNEYPLDTFKYEVLMYFDNLDLSILQEAERHIINTVPCINEHTW